MADYSAKHGRDQPLDFQGFLNDLQDWELSGKDKKLKPQAIGKEKEGRRQAEKASPADYLKQYDPVNRLSRNFQTEQSFVDAASEKEQGNEYFKQKKFKEAVDCYSRSIALSPTAVAFANRAMAYLKIRRFQEAEDDCTEALNLDDRLIKAYSRRATARKELGKAKEALEDAEFAQRLEPNNQEIKKQHAELRALVGKEILDRASDALRSSAKDKETVENFHSRAKIQDISAVSSSTLKTGLSTSQERIEGLSSDLQDSKLSLKEKDKKLKPQAVGKEKEAEKASPADYLKQYDPVNSLSRNFQTEQSFVDAASEKEQGNEYFKQKKFKEAIDCYSRSIALSPTAVAFTNRAMAYLKIRRFQEAEDDCTEALNLDDRYIKAYSRRATARKELGKAKEALEDAEFAQRLEPNNQEIKKQHAELKALVGKAILDRASGALRSSIKDKETVEIFNPEAKIQDISTVSSSTIRTSTFKERIEENGEEKAVKASARLGATEDRSRGAELRYKQETKNGFHEDPSSHLGASERNHVSRKPELKSSVQELASQAASRSMVEAAKNIIAPTTAYQFELSWRGFSGDLALQACLLKAISPVKLPHIFKNALTTPILIDIVKCVATFFTEEMNLAISFLENLAKVPRFSILMMCLPSHEKSGLLKIWDEVFCVKAVPIEYAEMLDSLRSKYFLKQ